MSPPRPERTHARITEHPASATTTGLLYVVTCGACGDIARTPNLTRARTHLVRHWAPRHTPTTITCPRCARTSHHPEDIRQGYCAHCATWTSTPYGLPTPPAPTTTTEHPYSPPVHSAHRTSTPRTSR